MKLFCNSIFLLCCWFYFDWGCLGQQQARETEDEYLNVQKIKSQYQLAFSQRSKGILTFSTMWEPSSRECQCSQDSLTCSSKRACLGGHKMQEAKRLSLCEAISKMKNSCCHSDPDSVCFHHSFSFLGSLKTNVAYKQWRGMPYLE